MAYKVIILYQLYMPSYFLGTFTEYPEGNQSFADDKVRYCVNRKTGLSKYSVLFFFIFMFYFQLIFIDVFFFIVNLKKWLCPESTFTDAVLHGQ